MGSCAAGLDAARPGQATSAVRVSSPGTQQLGRCSPLPRPAPQGRRGDSGGVGKADSEVALVAAGAASGNAVAAGGADGDGAAGVARREPGAGELGLGGKRRFGLAPPRAYPPPKRRLVSAVRRFPPGCGRDARSRLVAGGVDAAEAAPSLAIGNDDSSGMEVSAAVAPAPLAAGADGGSDTVHNVAPPSIGEAELNVVEVSAAVVSAPLADGVGSHGPDAGPLRSSEPLSPSDLASAGGLLDTDSQGGGEAGSAAIGGKVLVPATRLLPKPGRASAIRRFPPGCGRVGVSKKVMFTDRKMLKPGTLIKKSSLDSRPKPSSKDKEKKTELGRRVMTSGFEDTADFTKDRVDRVEQAPKSVDKCHWKDSEQATTSRSFFGPKKKVYSKKGPALQNKLPPELKREILKALAAHEKKLAFPQNMDARSKVKMICRRFEFIFRAIAEAAGQHSLKIKRIDTEAANLIRESPGFTHHGPIVGNVPGVEIGDEYIYRVELSIVGLHRPYQGGIDTTRDGNGMLIAISVVASGGYPDELSSSGELVYTGSGGKVSGKKGEGDQKLERGNLALKNCIKTKTPVRVIHGFGSQRTKETSTFMYDGLYHVVGCWREGQPGSKVFKYKLQRIVGQPELPRYSKAAHKGKTGTTR